MAVLIVRHGDAVESEIPLTGHSLKIGRDSKNDLVLDDATKGVSRFHAEIRSEGDRYAIADLNSRNGLWVNRRRVRRAVLAFGIPVTLGAYELILQDEAATQGEDTSSTVGTTVAGVAGHRVAPGDRAAPSGAHRMGTGAVGVLSSAVNRRAALWAGAAMAILVIVGASIALGRYSRRPAPGVTETPRPASTADRPTENPVPQPIAPQDTGASPPKSQPEQEIAAAAAAPAQKPKPARPAADVALVPGIPRLSNEPRAEYEDRARRIQTRYAQGRQELEQKQFGAALSSFEAVERDLANYSNVRSLIADATSRRSAAFQDAMANGAKNEDGGQLAAAFKWYVQAEQYDAGSSAADKAKAVRDRLSTDAEAKFAKAATLEKLRKRPEAAKLYREVVDALPEGIELRDQALQRLKALQ